MDRIDILCSLLLAGMVLFMGFGLYKCYQHEQFLKEHGCQLLAEAPTGRTRLVGKITRAERVYVYECADGTRTEVY